MFILVDYPAFEEEAVCVKIQVAKVETFTEVDFVSLGIPIIQFSQPHSGPRAISVDTL